MKPEDMTELLQFHDKTWTNKLLLMDEQRKWFLEMESDHGEDVVSIVEMTTKALEDYKNQTDKPVAGFEKNEHNLESTTIVG